MDFKKLIAATAIFFVSGGTYAQQTEFLAADAGFKPAMTRAEARTGAKDADAVGTARQGRYDGQDPMYSAGNQIRGDVRAETIRFAKTHHAGDTRDLYFGQ